MRIAFYISSLGKGGAERVITNIANYFANDEKNKVYLILERPTINYTVNNNINIIVLENKISHYNIISKKLRYIKYYFKLKKIFKTINPEIIVSFLAVPSFMAILTKPKKCRIIVGVRNDPKTEYTTFLKKTLMLRLYPKADAFVFQTNDAKEYFKNIISCKQTIIYNAISQDFINYNSNIKKEKKIVAVGRLHWQKNYPLLINAFESFSKKYDDYKLIIYGEGDERNNLQSIIDNKNLNMKVYLAGNVNDVKKYICDSMLFVMTSDFEGMPNSLIEAMVLGLPVISTDCPCGGPRELIINNKNGLLIEPGNEEELISAMERIISDEKFANSIGSEAKKIIDKVNPNYINKQWEKFVLEIYNDRGE